MGIFLQTEIAHQLKSDSIISSGFSQFLITINTKYSGQDYFHK